MSYASASRALDMSARLDGHGQSVAFVSSGGHGEPGQYDGLATISEELENAPAERIMAWAVERFGRGLSVAASFQDCVLIDVATRIDPGIEVIFLDTGFHFPETLDYVEEVRSRYALNLRIVRPTVGPGEHPCGTDRCCELRKVIPLRQALAGKKAWVSGLRRVDTPERSRAPIVAFDFKHGVVKVNPLAAWTDADMEEYVRANDLPVHSLALKGYASIGCAPTTSPVNQGEGPRSGRWRGLTKTECGLHT